MVAKLPMLLPRAVRDQAVMPQVEHPVVAPFLRLATLSVPSGTLSVFRILFPIRGIFLAGGSVSVLLFHYYREARITLFEIGA
jgi:hypothetical protein